MLCAVLSLPMTIDESSSVHENFSNDETFREVSEIDAGGQQEPEIWIPSA